MSKQATCCQLMNWRIWPTRPKQNEGRVPLNIQTQITFLNVGLKPNSIDKQKKSKGKKIVEKEEENKSNKRVIQWWDTAAVARTTRAKRNASQDLV